MRNIKNIEGERKRGKGRKRNVKKDANMKRERVNQNINDFRNDLKIVCVLTS